MQAKVDKTPYRFQVVKPESDSFMNREGFFLIAFLRPVRRTKIPAQSRARRSQAEALRVHEKQRPSLFVILLIVLTQTYMILRVRRRRNRLSQSSSVLVLSTGRCRFGQALFDLNQGI